MNTKLGLSSEFWTGSLVTVAGLIFNVSKLFTGGFFRIV
jgi:hypothetical protein